MDSTERSSRTDPHHGIVIPGADTPHAVVHAERTGLRRIAVVRAFVDRGSHDDLNSTESASYTPIMRPFPWESATRCQLPEVNLGAYSFVTWGQILSVPMFLLGLYLVMRKPRVAAGAK